ncbi:MAG: hypothetical protein CHACPFDD_02841 [Phycisphaerae bacterium]|nr:hypothetical protein [Phycisphaerae bacterium]
MLGRTLALSCLLLTASSAFAAHVLVSNMDEAVRASTAIGGESNAVAPDHENDNWYWAAQSFFTGDSGARLISIEAMAGDAVGAPLVFAELHAYNDGEIGELVATLSVPDLTGDIGPRVFVPTTPVMLTANTTYWLVLGAEAPGDGGFYWSYAASNDFAGPGALGPWAYSTDSGASWTIGSDFPWMVRVNARRLQPIGAPAFVDMP